MASSVPEYWLRGPVDGIPALLQPAAHALLQTRLEARMYTKDFDESLLWEMPHGRANVGFHLQHIAGVIDRMLTYADQKSLSEIQFEYLKQEGKPNQDIQLEDLLFHLETKIDEALLYFKGIEIQKLTDYRSVGRKEMPSTLLGVLFHAAEHSQRHVGQLLVTVSAFKN
ncbi:DinB family protein [Psychroflexus sp. CAK8W]|uniref:DinB family protein n=1 Tax=Psychroflexus longus TaxID=2873596 RepID=A0ABS7XHH4_9FLAO|nr:DinB family protein [Psychroflexus longus]MBZ9778407.1 DinB family protein [Psychroflexus longus]